MVPAKRNMAVLLLTLVMLGLFGGVTHADSGPSKKGMAITLTADPTQYVAVGRTPLSIIMDVQASQPGSYSGVLAVGGRWWDREFYPYKSPAGMEKAIQRKMSPNINVTNMYCDWWGCRFYWTATLEKNQKAATLTIYTFANALAGEHLVATATSEGHEWLLYVTAVAPTP